MNYNHLFYFYQVVKSNGIAEAARFLKITQPALSAQIKIFETQCGGPLLEKVKGEAKLTRRGELVFEFAIGMFEKTDSLQRMLKEDIKTKSFDILKLGVSDDIERSFVIEIIKTFYSGYETKHRPQILVSSLPPSSVLSELRRGSLDLVVTDRPNFSEDLISLAEYPMPVGVVFHRYSKYISEENHRAILNAKTAHHPALRRLILSGCAFPSRPSKLREETDLFLEDIKVSIEPLIESNIIAILKRAVLDDIVSAILPIPYVIQKGNVNQLLVAAPKGGLWKHSLQLVARAKSAKIPVLVKFQQAFMGLMTQFGEIESNIHLSKSSTSS